MKFDVEEVCFCCEFSKRHNFANSIFCASITAYFSSCFVAAAAGGGIHITCGFRHLNGLHCVHCTVVAQTNTGLGL